jgi:pimeloyl-ACP methyl ester carboxylesterase
MAGQACRNPGLPFDYKRRFKGMNKLYAAACGLLLAALSQGEGEEGMSTQKISPTTAAQPAAGTLAVPGATLAYDVRRNEESREPVLLLVGSPMGAGGFGTLAGHFTDRTVVTYDPRGSERSVKTDPESLVTPEVHAEDLHRLIEAVGGGPVDLFASSGGAVKQALAAVRAVHETYQRRGWGAGMAHFIAITSHRGPFTAELARRPAPDPAMFGLPASDDGTRADPLLGQAIIAVTHYEPDFAALRAAATRILIAAGVDSGGEMAGRAAHAVAERLGSKAVTFPSGHAGFLGGEYGQTGEPDAFAAKLREVLEQGSR